MSLIRQLWIAVALMMSIAFISSFSISTYKAKDYFEEQLLLKNIDNANSLALTLSQLEKDPVTLELLIAAQFDTGHYQRIELIDPEGNSVQKRVFDGDDSLGVPDWFTRFASLEIKPGVAQVQDGWFQFGTLFVESHTRFAYQALWATTRDLFLWFFAVSLGAGVLGTLILKYITRPLDDVVNQAEAIGGRRFITSDEPKTLEFGRVVRAMNILSSRVRSMLDAERERLEELRYKNQHDALTGLANREYFLSLLDACLHGKDKDAQHAILLVRVSHLAELNNQLGHKAVDQLLTDLVATIQSRVHSLSSSYTQADLGRLNGSDFAVLASDANDLETLSDQILEALVDFSEGYAIKLQLPMAATYFSPSVNRGSLMMQLDTLLARAEQGQSTCSELCLVSQSTQRFSNADEWRVVLMEAIIREQIHAEHFPVYSLSGELIHQESMMRLTLAGEVHTAGYFIPWARRLGMMQQLDLAMIAHQLKHLSSKDRLKPTAINISAETLSDIVTVHKIQVLLQERPGVAPYVSFEVNERSVAQNPDVFREFCLLMKPLGCTIGLERAGSDFAKINNLQEFGLDYIKVDYALIQEVECGNTQQSFLRGLATLGHSIGLQVIADGVREPSVIPALKEIGMDGCTGPGVNKDSFKDF